MANRRPLVRSGGKNVQIPAGDGLLLRGDLVLNAQTAVSSAATTVLAASTSNQLTVTGTESISSFGSAPAGTWKWVTFSDAATLVNGDDLSLPTGSNIVTAAGDSLLAICPVDNSWRVRFYQRKNGTPLVGGSDTTKLPLAGGRMTGAINESAFIGCATGGNAPIAADVVGASNNLYVYGSGSIPSLAEMPEGSVRRLFFFTACLLQNGSTLLLLTGANINAAVGDWCQFVSMGSSGWRMSSYTRFDGTALVAPAGGTGDFKKDGSVQMTGPVNEAAMIQIGSDTTTNIGAVAANVVDLFYNNSTTITSFGTAAAGIRRTVTRTGRNAAGLIGQDTAAITLTHNSDTLVLPTSANIVMRIGDSIEMESLGGGKWHCLDYQRGDGTALAGSPDATKVPLTAVGAANGVAPLGSDSKIAAAYLPSYVDDVLEFANLAAFPATGETGKIYIALDTNREYRWSGSTYIQLVSSPGTTDNVPEGTTNLYFTAARVLATVLSGLSLLTGSAVVATDSILVAIGKLQAQNTAQDTAISGKEPTISAGSAGQYWNGLKAFADFATSVRAAALTGLSLATNSAITATDTVLTALGKLQAQLNASVSRTETITTTSVGQTSYSIPNGYVVGAINVFLNGVLLAPADYTATDGANVVLASGALTTSDIMSVLVIGSVRAQDDALLQYTVAALPAASANAFKQRWCTNMAGGAGVVVSNGTNWLRVADNTVVTT